jgi:hypothetical protein
MTTDLFFQRLWALAPHVAPEDREWFEDYLDAYPRELIFLDQYSPVSFHALFNQHDWTNFLYDKATSTVFAHTSGTSHESIMTKLYSFHKIVIGEGKPLEAALDFDSHSGYSNGAEKFIGENMGFFRSSVSSHIDLSKTYRLSRREQIFFHGFKFRQLEF